jgi:D-alanine-D-alanine ligase
MTKKLRVALLFGGKSTEHEISIQSAIEVMQHLDTTKYTVLPIGITKDGIWQKNITPEVLLAQSTLPIENIASKRSATASSQTMLPLQHDGELRTIDIVFPLLHGPNGEDGTVQGFLEVADIAYVGCDVLTSALTMNKAKTKEILTFHNVPVVPWVAITRTQWHTDAKKSIATIEATLPYPVFVKPNQQGSSIGVSKAKNREELRDALELASQFDTTILIEQAINCRELECGILGNDPLQASVIGESITRYESYSYEAKYQDSALHLQIPADIPQKITKQVQSMAIQACTVLGVHGLARVDFFLERQTGNIYINEINAMPGFTQVSMYPKVWEASGIPFSELLDRLIALGREHYLEKLQNHYTR